MCQQSPHNVRTTKSINMDVLKHTRQQVGKQRCSVYVTHESHHTTKLHTPDLACALQPSTRELVMGEG